MTRLLLLFCLPLAQGFASLTWINTEVKMAAGLSDSSAVGTYKFKNDTGKSITITDTKSSCGCTTAKLEKTTYAPGESGEIKAQFDLGGRIGPQHKTITVTTNDAPDSPTVLELSVDIPDPLEISSALLVWKVGDKPTEQIVTVKVKEGFQVKVQDIRCSNPSFTARLNAAKEGHRYDIAITPTSLEKKVFGLLIVTTDFPANNPRVVYSQLQVQ